MIYVYIYRYTSSRFVLFPILNAVIEFSYSCNHESRGGKKKTIFSPDFLEPQSVASIVKTATRHAINRAKIMPPPPSYTYLPTNLQGV